jgi:hypothetical protein
MSGSHHPDDGGKKLLWNVGQYLPDYTIQHLTSQTSSRIHNTFINWNRNTDVVALNVHSNCMRIYSTSLYLHVNEEKKRKEVRNGRHGSTWNFTGSHKLHVTHNMDLAIYYISARVAWNWWLLVAIMTYSRSQAKGFTAWWGNSSSSSSGMQGTKYRNSQKLPFKNMFTGNNIAVRKYLKIFWDCTWDYTHVY